jgi:hypothetical protein
LARGLHERSAMRCAALSIFAACVTACVGTMEEKLPIAADGPDAGASAGACDPIEAPASDGHHNAGTACQDCHAAGGGAPTFTAAGTVYDGVAGAPVAGATIHLIDADGNDIALVSAANGNFWTTQAVTFPLTTHASACPDTMPMISPVTESGADCNTGGCHADGFRIHVP